VLKEINKNFLSSLSEIEKEKKNLTEIMDKVIVEATSSYPERVKEQKLKITNLKDLKKQKEKTISEINKAKEKNQAETISKLNVKKIKI
jgi:hypothetical protein